MSGFQGYFGCPQFFGNILRSPLDKTPTNICSQLLSGSCALVNADACSGITPHGSSDFL